MQYRRIILKLSGESLSPDLIKLAHEYKESDKKKDGNRCFDGTRLGCLADTLIRLQAAGAQLGIVMGGGNIWRGRFSGAQSEAMNPVNADQMGMLATIINALAVQDAIVRHGGRASVLTAQEMNRFAELYTRDRALALMEAGHIVLLAGGSGNPFFTTDTAAALRAAELDADAIFKGTTVEGIFEGDPEEDPEAKFLPKVTYAEAIERRLAVMDLTAFTLCMERHIPCIRVFSIENLENILRVANGEPLGTVVSE